MLDKLHQASFCCPTLATYLLSGIHAANFTHSKKFIMSKYLCVPNNVFSDFVNFRVLMFSSILILFTNTGGVVWKKPLTSECHKLKKTLKKH